MQADLFTEAQKQISAPSQQEKSPIHFSAALRQNTATIDAALQSIFKSTQEETRLQQARRTMGAGIDCLPDEELEVCLTEFQHLLDEWFDSFEQEVFDGRTLRQVLGRA